ncbi:hypothetical protein D3C80_1508850 [compost metagenome]
MNTGLAAKQVHQQAAAIEAGTDRAAAKAVRRTDQLMGSLDYLVDALGTGAGGCCHGLGRGGLLAGFWCRVGQGEIGKQAACGNQEKELGHNAYRCSETNSREGRACVLG